jgi:hypothetical protein
MKRLSIFCCCFFITVNCVAQNVGIGVPAPAEKLDVAGNINLTGTIKVNGIAGTASQVLMKDALGNMAWADLNSYKNFVSFTATGAGTWIVPDTVTSILAEVTGAGSGGTIWGGGSGGGYIIAQLEVVPGSTLNFTVGAGSAGSTGGNSLVADNTTFINGGITLTALGGGGVFYNGATKLLSSSGGSFVITPTSFKNFIGLSGYTGEVSQVSFEQKSATSFFEISKGGDGGGPGYCRTCGARGSYYAYDIESAVVFRQRNAEGGLFFSSKGAGGGGGYALSSVGGFGGVSNGTGGSVIIRY